jgi:hypothetical protein
MSDELNQTLFEKGIQAERMCTMCNTLLSFQSKPHINDFLAVQPPARRLIHRLRVPTLALRRIFYNYSRLLLIKREFPEILHPRTGKPGHLERVKPSSLPKVQAAGPGERICAGPSKAMLRGVDMRALKYNELPNSIATKKICGVGVALSSLSRPGMRGPPAVIPARQIPSRTFERRQ